MISYESLYAFVQTGPQMTNYSKYQSQAKIEELESIRGLAALLIVFVHMPQWNPISDIGIIKNGYLMVDLFFVLSGYVIFNAYEHKINSTRDLMRFQFLRLGRLYPVHLMFLIVFVFIELAKYVAKIKFEIKSPNSTPFEENNLEAFIRNIFLIQAILPNYKDTFNIPSWSISVEFYTYLVFGFIALFASRLKLKIFVLLAVVSLVILSSELMIAFNALLSCFAGFFVGCLTASAVKNIKIAIPSYLSVLILAVIILFLQLKTSGSFDLLIFFLTAALIAALILSPNGLLNKLLRLKVLTWLGTISYSVYMSHTAIEWTINQVMRFALRRSEITADDGLIYPQLSTVEALIAYTIVLCNVLLVSTIVYRFFEQPVRQKSRRIAFTRL